MDRPQEIGVLYTADILALAIDLANYPLDGELQTRGEAHSRNCGSSVIIGFDLDSEGKITRSGALVSACAIGQAAAAIFLRQAHGCNVAEVADTAEGLAEWLAGKHPIPSWPGLAELEPARAYPARHGAIVLPWQAAKDALSISYSTG